MEKSIHNALVPLINNANQVISVVNNLQKLNIDMIKTMASKMEKMVKFIESRFQAMCVVQNEKQEVQSLL